MASSENLESLEPWSFPQNFPDLWISEAYARDTDTLTKVLQKSFCNNSSIAANNAANPVSETLTSDSFLAFINGETASPALPPATPSASNVSGSDPETAPKRQRNAMPGATGKVSKRKSRASKKSQTTFITADPANFRQMVQQVTGIRFASSQMPLAPVLKPEPQRLGGRFQGCGGAGGGAGCLPTLDTSTFLLDHHHGQMVMGSTSGSGSGPIVGPGPMCFTQSLVADGGRGGAGSAPGLDFDFPTLESWKVM
uniref:Uncharacterized protein LOC105136902 n=1 Tax=Rhizophora mucronata TaxID=61149 RepID=A0A2P2ME55_RHIMU